MANVALVNPPRLDGNADGTDLTVYTTASFAPSAGNHLVTFCVFGWHGTGGVATVAPTLSGGGVTTWTRETGADVAYDTNRAGMFLYRALQGSWGGAATATITWGGGVSTCAWVICEWENVDTSGTNGSGALRQVAINTSAGATSLTATLAALNSSESMSVGWGSAIGVTTLTSEGGATAQAGFAPASPELRVRHHYLLNDTTVNFLSSSSMPMGVIGW
jgi:hypothetical protein